MVGDMISVYDMTVLNGILSPLKLTLFQQKIPASLTASLRYALHQLKVSCNVWSYDIYDMTIATE